jgi:hypothetical protein
MPDDFKNTSLWRRTLSSQGTSDTHAEPRTILREAYLAMRKNASELVKLIPGDCRPLTVHDITHLDALWEMADLIAGSDFSINPAESFVFGAAVLIHDAGMTVAAFPGGMTEITQTMAWSDTVYAFYRKRGLPEPNRDAVHNPPTAFKEEILFHVLRVLHAQQAEKLISTRWKIPGSNEDVCLLENQHLRVEYAESIGKIAHSHNWDLERLNTELRDTVGAATELPLEWTVNEIKVACLLRCADAAHIDHRRAPSMLYALSKPKGTSDTHWRFQHKLRKPTLLHGSLLYSSGQDFALDEAQAWWLCYDAIRMIDHELSSSNALLQDIETGMFAVSRVYGAESPRILARHVRPLGWRPVDAEIKVSDPAQLANTLGGRNLYGRGAYAPIRELLQNAADAIRARRRLEDRDVAWGRIRLILESAGSDTWLHVDDTGVGMSERVLVGPLLDFGRSFWNSPLLQEEFPGLESRGIKPLGKFGIGFFSVFLLGDNVKVITRPYNGGLEDARVLEFSSISARPILRNAEAVELPIDFTTRVSVRLKDLKELSEPLTHSLIFRQQHPEVPQYLDIHQIIAQRIRRLIAGLDVTTELDDKISKTKYLHNADWRTSAAEQFLDEILSEVPQSARKEIIQIHERLLSPLESQSGEYLGRAALWMHPSDDRHPPAEVSSISVGGFSYPPRRTNFRFVGLLTGDTQDVTRRTADPQVSQPVIASWASQQAKLIDPSKF